MNRIVKDGYQCSKDDSEIYEVLGLHYQIANPIKLYSDNLNLNLNSHKFIDLAKNGAFDIEGYPLKGEALSDYIDSINQYDKIYIHENDQAFVYTYPERIKHYLSCDIEDNIIFYNQLDNIIKRLKNNIGSNRAIAVLYQAGLDSQAIDIPCLQLIQAFVRDNKLILSVFFRSNDIYGAFPSNMLFISNIGIVIQEELRKINPNIKFEYIDYHVSSAHIYETDLDAVKAKIGV